MLFYQNSNNSLSKYFIFITISILVGFFSSINPTLLVTLLILIVSLVIYIYKNNYKKIYTFMILFLLISAGFIQMILLRFGIISSGTILSIVVYYFPILYIWMEGVFLSNIFGKNKLSFLKVDYLVLVCFFYLLLLVLFADKPSGYDVFIMSVLRFSLFIPAYFFGRRLIYENFKGLNKTMFFLTVIIALFGIVDVATRHQLLNNLGLNIFLGSEASSNESMTIFYKAGYPRMMSLLLSPLALGTLSSAMVQYWYYKTIIDKEKNIIPLLITMFILALTFSRASWISCLIGIFIISIIHLIKGAKIQKIFRVNYLFSLLSLIMLLIILKNDNLISFFLSTLNGNESSTSEHFRGITQGFQEIKNSIIIGNGIGVSPYFQVVSKNISLNFESWYLDSIFSAGLIYIVLFHLIAFAGINSVKLKEKVLFIALFISLSFESFINHTWYQTLPVLIFWGSLGYFISKSQNLKESN